MNAEFGIAVHALVYLHRHRSAAISSDVLAKNTCTHPAKIRAIMAKLRRENWIASKEGANGGYFLAADPGRITLAEICRAVKTQPVDAPRPSGDVDMDCLIASGMGAVMADIYDELNEIGLRHLAAITLEDIDTKLFNRPRCTAEPVSTSAAYRQNPW